MLLTAHVDVTALAQHPKNKHRKNHKSNGNLPHISPIMKKALTGRAC